MQFCNDETIKSTLQNTLNLVEGIKSARRIGEREEEKKETDRRSRVRSSARWKPGVRHCWKVVDAKLPRSSEVEAGNRGGLVGRLRCIAASGRSVGLLHHTAIREAESATLQASAPTRTHATRRN